MTKSDLTDVVTGPKDGTCGGASRYGDGTLRLALQLMRDEYGYNKRSADAFFKNNSFIAGNAYHNTATLYAAAIAAIEDAIKQMASSDEAGTPNSSPSP